MILHCHGIVECGYRNHLPSICLGFCPTFPGKMHEILSGVVGLLGILYMLLLGIRLNRAEIFPGFGTYSFISIGVVVLSAGFFIATLGSPLMGITERITILVGFQWTFILALWMFSRKGYASR